MNIFICGCTIVITLIGQLIFTHICSYLLRKDPLNGTFIDSLSQPTVFFSPAVPSHLHGNSLHCFSQCTCKRMGACHWPVTHIGSIHRYKCVVFNLLFLKTVFATSQSFQGSGFSIWILFSVFFGISYTETFSLLWRVLITCSYIPTFLRSYAFAELKWARLGVFELLDSFQLFNWVLV